MSISKGKPSMRGNVGLVMILVSIMLCGVAFLLPQFLSPLGQVFCTEDETYQAEVVGTGNLSRGRINPLYSCVDTNGTPRNINDQVIPIVTIVLLGLCLGGVFLARERLERLPKMLQKRKREK